MKGYNAICACSETVNPSQPPDASSNDRFEEESKRWEDVRLPSYPPGFWPFKKRRWLTRTSGGAIPPRAVHCTKTTYIGIVQHEGERIPGTLVPSQGCYVPYAGREYRYDKYDILQNRGGLQWIADSGGSVPFSAIVGGTTRSHETLYIGRAQHAGKRIVGKIQPSLGCLCIAYGGREHRYSEYEVLCELKE